MEFIETIHKGWKDLLGNYLTSPKFKELTRQLETLNKTCVMVPALKDCLAPLKIDPDSINMLYIFSYIVNVRTFNKGIPYSIDLYTVVPKQIAYFYKELMQTKGVNPNDLTNFDLSHWLEQGVFLWTIYPTIAEFGEEAHDCWHDFVNTLFRRFFKRYSNKSLGIIVIGNKAKEIMSKFDISSNHVFKYYPKGIKGVDLRNTGVFENLKAIKGFKYVPS